MTELLFPDRESLLDLGRYAARAKTVDEGGAIRLQARGTTLAAYAGVLAGSGLLGEGAVIGLRVMALAEPADLDVTVPLSAITDRTAREESDATADANAPAALPLPPMTASTSWAALSPPRSGWERVGAISAEQVTQVARAGIEEIAQGSPEGAGGHAVGALRQRVWGASAPTIPPFPAGGAFAAYVLGFCEPDGQVTVFAQGRWTRLSTPVGHVLIR